MNCITKCNAHYSIINLLWSLGGGRVVQKYGLFLLIFSFWGYNKYMVTPINFISMCQFSNYIYQHAI